MDLSKTAKKKRDVVEAPLFRLGQLMDQLDQVQTRIDATTAVWVETKRTLQPASKSLHDIQRELDALKKDLSRLWQEGFEMKWKVGK